MLRLFKVKNAKGKWIYFENKMAAKDFADSMSHVEDKGDIRNYPVRRGPDHMGPHGKHPAQRKDRRDS